jgi:DNA-binding transcriptional LysR family regulator
MIWTIDILDDGSRRSVELRQLKVFVAVLEAGSFTAAASRLGYVQSSVSANIQALEHELGVPLFDRIGHRVLPTSAARRLEATVRPVLAALDAAARQATNPEPSGLVVLGTAETPATYRLPPVIGELARRFPALEVVLRPGSCDAHRAALRRGEMDAAVLLHDGQETPEFEVWPLWQEEILLVASPRHPAADPLLSTADLAVYPYLATEPGTYRAAWEARCETAGVKIRVVELVQVELIKRCVEAGLGFSILPAVAVEDEVRAGRLSARPLPDARLIMTTSLVRLRDRWRPPALDALIAQLQAAAAP